MAFILVNLTALQPKATRNTIVEQVELFLVDSREIPCHGKLWGV